MNLQKLKGKSFLVNLLSDFILNKIPKEKNTIIKVVDCENFYVVKGKTESNEILNLSEITTEFENRYQNFLDGKKISHVIDLIEYDKDLDEITELEFTYHNNTPNCTYHYLDVEKFNDSSEEKNKLIYVSEFPYGYSLSQGRILYYYGKHIFYNIPQDYIHTSLKFTISTEKDVEGDMKFKVIDEFSKFEDETLRSAILDVFDFNMKKIESKLKKVDWSVELTDPLSEYDFLKEKVEGFIIP